MKRLLAIIALGTVCLFILPSTPGCATTYHDPDTGEQVLDPVPVDEDGDGTVNHFEDPDKPGVPLEERTEIDADAAAGAASAVAPFLGPWGAAVMPALSILTLVMNRKK